MEATYKKILDLIKKHKSEVVFDYDQLERLAKNHLFGLKLKNEYGLNIDPKKITGTEWCKLNENFSVGMWGEKYNRTISWPDVKGQPENELLLYISFPTGAYLFGGDYPTEFFKQFWEELKTYNPKYLDSMNHSIFFAMDNARDIFNNYDAILQKYYELNREDMKARKILKMKEDLAKLENAS